MCPSSASVGRVVERPRLRGSLTPLFFLIWSTSLGRIVGISTSLHSFSHPSCQSGNHADSGRPHGHSVALPDFRRQDRVPNTAAGNRLEVPAFALALQLPHQSSEP